MSFNAATLCVLALFILVPVAICLIEDLLLTAGMAVYYHKCAKAKARKERNNVY